MAVGFAGRTRIVAAGKQEESMKVPEADRGVRAEVAGAKKFVYGFLEDPGIDDVRSLLGGKGAGIREMRKLGFPVPEGFTITTEACTLYIQSGELTEGLMDDVKSHMALVEVATDRAFGSPVNPLLVSVRSGAPVSMPGMMDTVLNLGLNDETVRGLAQRTGDERFAYDSYRRFIQAFGEIVLKVPGHLFEDALEEVKGRRGVEADTQLSADELKELTDRFKATISERSEEEFPEDPVRQLELAIKAVFDSWLGERAAAYRKEYAIPDSLGTAVPLH